MAATPEAPDVNLDRDDVERGNLFPAGHPDGPPDRETYDVKIAYLATTIRGLNPDVVALQEIGDPQCAQDLARAVGDDCPIQLADACAGNHPIRAGVLSPHPVTVEDQVVKLPDAGLPAVPDVDGSTLKRMGRAALQVTVDVRGGLRLLACHLKSKLLTYPEDRGYSKNEDKRASAPVVVEVKLAGNPEARRVCPSALLRRVSAGARP